MARELPQQGTLDAHPLPRVLLDLCGRGFSGRLQLSRGSRVQTTTWRRGAPVESVSSDEADSLGAWLAAQGRIDETSREKLAAHQERRGVPEAAALLALKLLEPKELVEALREQIFRRLADACAWEDGSFAAEPGEAGAEETEAFRVDPVRIVQDAVARHWRPDRILGDLEDRIERYAVPGERFEALAARLEPTPEARAVLDSLDPARSFGASVCTSLEPGRLAAAWLLAETGALTFQDDPPAEDTAQEDPEPEPDADATPALDIEIEVRGGDADAEPSDEDEPVMQLELPSAEAEELRKDILARHERLDEIDHYEVLGVEADAADSAVKKAYFACAKRFHPDAVSRLGLSALHREANEVFARIAQAYQTLSDPKKRQAYDQREQNEGASAHANRIAQAETLFRKGEVLIKVGNFSGALDFLRPCVELWPEEADYQAGLGWALYKNKPSDPDKAREHLEKANALRADDPLVLFRLGMVLRRLGEKEEAAELLERSKAIEKQAKG